MDAGTGVHTATLNRDAGIAILNDYDIYDGDFAVLGHLPLSTWASVATADDTKAYSYDEAGSVRAFDLGSLDDSSELFLEIASVVLPDTPGTSARAVEMAISLDEKHLFIAGDNAVIVTAIHN